MEPHEPRSRVLVVDDNEQNRALAQATLEDDGYEVVVAVTGQEGIQQFERHRPAYVLLDVRMPGMDGFAVCARIRGLPGGESTPIVFLTALRDVDTFDSALRAGGDDFLTKPVRPSELLVRVQARGAKGDAAAKTLAESRARFGDQLVAMRNRLSTANASSAGVVKDFASAIPQLPTHEGMDTT